jgi:hypothetical protein
MKKPVKKPMKKPVQKPVQKLVRIFLSHRTVIGLLDTDTGLASITVWWKNNCVSKISCYVFRRNNRVIRVLLQSDAKRNFARVYVWAFARVFARVFACVFAQCNWSLSVSPQRFTTRNYTLNHFRKSVTNFLIYATVMSGCRLHYIIWLVD